MEVEGKCKDPTGVMKACRQTLIGLEITEVTRTSRGGVIKLSYADQGWDEPSGCMMQVQTESIEDQKEAEALASSRAFTRLEMLSGDQAVIERAKRFNANVA